ncbi:hypothetical protein P7J56_05775 [Streptococcus suis]|uniref:hypothetical protein n=1 Tax=Streptococcus suis TaxID=1307 RepID=UPI00128FFFDF|nr:hypothetical protein [Streptococcus suis]
MFAPSVETVNPRLASAPLVASTIATVPTPVWSVAVPICKRVPAAPSSCVKLALATLTASPLNTNTLLAVMSTTGATFSG